MSRTARHLREKYESVSSTQVEHEDRMDTDGAQELWNEIYQLFGATAEAMQTNVRVAVYGYYAVNGASRRTPHGRDVTTSDGVTAPSAEVLKVIGKERIRKFMRADVVDAYSALKYSPVITTDEIFAAKMERERNVPRSYCYAAVDFLRGCPEFTPEEVKYSESAFRLGINRADNARRGISIDELDEDEKMKHVDAGKGRSGGKGSYDEF